MNYLAHLFLSGTDSSIIVGNLLEDFIKGGINNSRNSLFPLSIKMGIQLHRNIDVFTDTHSEVKKCKAFFYSKFAKFSPIVVDVLFDHFLIKNWSLFTTEPFEVFRKRAYGSLGLHQEVQPLAMKNRVRSMIEHDWLKNYIEIWGLERAFLGLNTKINRSDIDLRKSIPIFEANYQAIDTYFVSFFKDLKAECDLFLIENGFPTCQ
jgi:acyl carrier protein phosphodiesterase